MLIHSAVTWSTRGEHHPRVGALWRSQFPHDVAPRLGVRNTPAVMRPGHFVAIANLTDAHEASPMCGCGEWAESEYVDAAGTKRTSIVHLVLESIVALHLPGHPTARGRLGLWDPGPEITRHVTDLMAWFPDRPQ